MEDVLDGVGFEWRGDGNLHKVLYHLWTITAFSENSVRVLLNGATGTGKELLAKAIHQFVCGDPGTVYVTNCANLNPETAAAELFGASKGAYTGQQGERMGVFQMASDRNATLVLDEVHMLAPAVRTMLYRALHERTFTRMGDPSRMLEFHGHVVSAASSSLDGMIDDGSFPQDLLSRLSQTDDVHIPSFDARDSAHRSLVIEYGFDHWLQNGMQRDPAVEEALLQVKFPGNIRDLRSFVEQLAAYARRDAHLAGDSTKASVTMQNFTDVRAQPRWQNISSIQESPVSSPVHAIVSPTSLHAPLAIATLDELEANHVRSTLIALGWNKSKVAAALGIERGSLDRKMKRWGYVRPEEA